ncbi:MAG: hypothetical protein ICV60_24410, partial [Pyrinomonadaceae bacterium]|nr:hypothetical protein [Pyrinomonadaceae bacterium]
MKTFLLWPRLASLRREFEPERVAARLQKIFGELFSTPPDVIIRQTSTVNLILLHLPVSGWTPPFFEETEEAWAMAVDYPVDAAAVMESYAIKPREGQGTLLTLAHELEANPRALLRELSPPFSLIWSRKGSDELFLQNDGLGQSQLFEYRRGESWALTNRLSALKALDVRLEPDAAEWAARMILGWFPMQTTGFKRIKYVEPATQLRVDASGNITKTVKDVLGEWLTHTGLSLDDCLELARTSLLKHLKAVAPLWLNPTVGLTGGYDSRAVVASLRKLNLTFRAFVKGSTESNDVRIASQLAGIAGITLGRKSEAEMPAVDAQDLKRSIHLSLLWQAGFLDTEKYKSDFPSGQRLKAGVVRLMGQHGEIGRRYYHPLSEQELDILDSGINAAQLENIFAARLMIRTPSFIRKNLSEQARDLFIQAFRQADA